MKILEQARPARQAERAPNLATSWPTASPAVGATPGVLVTTVDQEAAAALSSAPPTRSSSPAVERLRAEQDSDAPGSWEGRAAGGVPGVCEAQPREGAQPPGAGPGAEPQVLRGVAAEAGGVAASFFPRYLGHKSTRPPGAS